MAPHARNLHWASVGLMAGATLLLLIVSFVPWHSWNVDDGEAHGTSGAWGYHERYGPLAHEAGSWFDSDWTDDGETRDGIVALRTGAILLTLGGLGAAVATAFILLDFRWRAGIVAGSAAITSIVATALIASGTMDWANIHVDRSVGYVLAVIACMAALAGALLAFLPTPGLGLQESLQQWSEKEPAE